MSYFINILKYRYLKNSCDLLKIIFCACAAHCAENILEEEVFFTRLYLAKAIFLGKSIPRHTENRVLDCD
jgi:hypothetical protein